MVIVKNPWTVFATRAGQAVFVMNQFARMDVVMGMATAERLMCVSAKLVIMETNARKSLVILAVNMDIVTLHGTAIVTRAGKVSSVTSHQTQLKYTKNS